MHNMLDGIQAFSIPLRAAPRPYEYSSTLRVCVATRQKRVNAAARVQSCVSNNSSLLFLLYCSHSVRPFFFCSDTSPLAWDCLHTMSFEQSTLTDLQSWCYFYVSDCPSIHATDLYAFGSVSSDVDKYSLSQEVIPAWMLVVGSWPPCTWRTWLSVMLDFVANYGHKASLTSICSACFRGCF